ncbi:hypothetical protein L798_09011 [Zootermopsis nevadensis]|uniref:Uncharacterized protein n=1 Tax=Zootermopsis nevadensis TaxID=136037 RepID=A0A067RB61_ZOONE|nr:hypothetical protein L798_09011 [Zootermopsis nevadensis]
MTNFYMENFEQLALSSFLYKMYILLQVHQHFRDLHHGKKEFQDFQMHLSNIHPNIKLTMGIEKFNILFLDMPIRKLQYQLKVSLSERGHLVSMTFRQLHRRYRVHT